MSQTISASALDSLKDTLTRRANKCISLSYPLLSAGEFFIAGSCISSSTVNDIDVFPVGEKEFPISFKDILSNTPSAVTVKSPTVGNPPIQFCKFRKPNLDSLLLSFDFSHVQAGAHIREGDVVSASHTDAYISYRLSSVVTYTRSEYPLSSLFRLVKYYKRGDIGRESSGLIISIMSAIVRRGFSNYEDFKRQLDAVDLGLIPEEIENLEREDLLSFFEALRKGAD